jgi:ATP-binding cassette, subfamily B, bacterial PglK
MKIILFLNKKRKLQVIMLGILMVITSIAEAFSLGAIFPFIAAIISPGKLIEIPLVEKLIAICGISSSSSLIAYITIIFCISAIISGFLRIILLNLNIKFSSEIGAEISSKLFQKILGKPYEYFYKKNSADIISGIMRQTTATRDYISAVLVILSSSIMLFSLFVVTVYINYRAVVGTFLFFGVIYCLIVLITKAKLIKNGRIAATQSWLSLRALNEGVGGIRDVIIDGSKNYFSEIYRKSHRPQLIAEGSSQFLGACPRYIIETIVVVALAVIAYFMLAKDGSIQDELPLIGLLAISAQKSLPLIQQIYTSWTIIQNNRTQLLDAIDTIKSVERIEHQTQEKLTFNNSIVLNHVSFKYSDTEDLILKNLNLKIIKGDKVGIMGLSGVGKSTLIDIIMGLSSPTSGSLLIDGDSINPSNVNAWQKNITHVPQSIYLMDGTIAQNIAFGKSIEETDLDLVYKAAECSQLGELIKTIKGGIHAQVGERGGSLSGGQVQRIGIARALYKNASVLILDEATSALDYETEMRIINELEKNFKQLTIINVTHKKHILENCSHIIELGQNYSIKIQSLK